MSSLTQRDPILFVLSAPSGTGKTTVVDALLLEEKKAKRTISHTTRALRAGEVEGKDYHFVSKDEFLNIKKSGGFLETAKVYEHYYGTSIQSVEDVFDEGKDAFLVIEWQGAEKLKARYPNLVRIMLLPPTAETLKTRIKGRKNTDLPEIERRLMSSQSELRAMMDYDFFVFNDEIKKAVYKIKNIIEAERLRLSRNQAMLHQFIDAFEVIET